MRPDLSTIIREARETGIPHIMVVTNGDRVAREHGLHAQLIDAGLDELVISLDYPDETHDHVRGIPGLYQRIVDFLAHNTGIVRINTIVMDDNVEQLPKMYDLAQRLGVPLSLNAYSPGRNDTERPQHKGYAAALEEALEAKKTGIVFNSERELRLLFGFLNGIPVPDCGAGELFTYITPDGKIQPCPDRPELVFDTWREAQEYNGLESCVDCYAGCRLPEVLARAPVPELISMALPYLGRVK